MTRNLKSFGLCLAAGLAAGIVAVSVALAAEFHSETKTTTPDATALSVQEFGNTSPGIVNCSSAKVEEGWLGSSTVKEVTIKPLYSECVATISGTEVEARITFTGCYFVFTNHTEAGGKLYVANLGCKEPKTEEVDVEGFVLGKFRLCHTVPAQTPTGGGLTYENTGSPSSVVVKATMEGIEYTRVAGPCGPAAVVNNGRYNGEVTVTGTSGEKQVGVWFE